MSKVDVIMPQMGESIAEGTLTRWLKNVGDAIDRDEDLFEISTDKVDADIPSPAAGVLVEVLVEEGETVEVNTIVARIETDAHASSAPAEAVPAEAAPAEAAPAEVVPQPTAGGPPAEPPAAEQTPTPTVAPTPEPPLTAPTTGPATQEERLRTRSTPLVRKIAAEQGVDISQVPGTGTSGRVTRDDIMAFIEASTEPAMGTAEPTGATASAASPTATSHASALQAPAPQPQVPAPTTPAPASPDSSALAVPAPNTIRVPIHGAILDIKLGKIPVREHDRVEEMSRVRLRTMEHMLMSTRVSAHVTSVSEIDFEHVVQLRRKMKGKFAEQGVKLTYGPFVYRAVIEGLRAYPILNASVDGTRIVYHANINLGVAVAVNDGTELIVPVIKDADRLSLLGLAQGANELAEKARSKTLGFDDIQGGSFTITNVGVFGNLFGTPIINQPQVAILGTGLIEKRPVVMQDGMGNDVIAIRHRAYFGLSYDHRVVDGAMAAFFLKEVQDYLENFPDEG